MTLGIRWGRFDARLRFRFRHASHDRGETENVIVEVTERGARGYGEGCPRLYVTGETQQTAFAFLAAHAGSFASEVHDVGSLRAWLTARRAEIDRHPAAFAALESAALDCFGHRDGAPLETLVGVDAPSAPFQFTAVLGDSRPAASMALAAIYRAYGFTHYKIKLGGDVKRDRARLQALRRVLGATARLRADANNVWSDPSSCITALSALGNPFWAVEEPLARGDVHGMRRVANSLRVPVILDESLLSVQQLDAFSSDATNWIANIRVSKAGGILRAIDLAREAHTRGLGIIVGAHVGESSLLTRAALCVAQSVRPHVLAQEGAYGHLLLAHDLTTPSLCFGAGGQLDLNRGGIQRRSGMGLTLNAPRITWVGVSA